MIEVGEVNVANIKQKTEGYDIEGEYAERLFAHGYNQALTTAITTLKELTPTISSNKTEV